MSLTPRAARRIPALIFVVAAGCSSADTIKRITPPEDDRIALEFLAAVRSHDTLTLQWRLASVVQRMPGWQDSLSRSASVLPEDPIDTLRQVGANVMTNRGLSQTLLSYEMHGRTGWGGVQIGIADQGNERKVFFFRSDKFSSSVEAANEFSNGAKNPARVVVLLIAVAMFLFTLSVAAMAVATPMKRRWLWGLFALVGGGQVALNWTTGALSFQPLQLVVFSSGLERMGTAGPWFILIAFPVGAVATLERLRRERNKTAIVASAGDDTQNPD